MRVGLVLGAGGVMGGAWLTGGLQALAAETGWDPGSADYVVGTSAGAMIGALNAAGVPPWFMVAHSEGEVFSGLRGPDGRPAEDADRAAGAVFGLERGALPLIPGSWRMVAAHIARPTAHAPSGIICGLLPRGMVSTEPLKGIVHRVVPEGWVEHPNFWAVACDYSNGRRVPFGDEGAPEAPIADAVAASCAIPGFYRPVEIDGKLYVDGGLWSTSNLDLLVDLELDLVVCLNPTSSLHPPRAWNPADRVQHLFRNTSGRRLGSEAKKVRASGTEVVLIQPVREDLDAMGPNLMSRRGRDQVIHTAIRTVGEQLRSPGVRELLRDLPEGDPYLVERPSTPPSEWPSIRESAARRWPSGAAA
jgi:NTE family protein